MQWSFLRDPIQRALKHTLLGKANQTRNKAELFICIYLRASFYCDCFQHAQIFIAGWLDTCSWHIHIQKSLAGNNTCLKLHLIKDLFNYISTHLRTGSTTGFWLFVWVNFYCLPRTHSEFPSDLHWLFIPSFYHLIIRF